MFVGDNIIIDRSTAIHGCQFDPQGFPLPLYHEAKPKT